MKKPIIDKLCKWAYKIVTKTEERSKHQVNDL